MVQPSQAHSCILLYWAATTCACGALIRGLTSDGALSLVSSADKARHMLERGNVDAFTSMLAQDMAQVVRVFLQSEMATFLLVNWLFATYSVVALVTMVVFLGRLTPRESSALTERLVKYCVFKLVFVGALLPPGMGEVAAWVGWFAIAGFMRIFMGVGRDRLEGLMAAPGAPLSAHMRAVTLVLLILVHDAIACTSLLSAANATTGLMELASGPVAGVAVAAAAAPGSLPPMDMSRALLCAFDMAVIAVEGLKTLVRYGVHVADMHIQAKAGDDDAALAGAAASWEGKGAVLYHVELVSDVLIHCLTIAHYMHVWYLHGLSFHIVDAVLLLDVRAVLGSLAKRLRGYAAYCTATHRLRHAFPDARPTEPEPCSICMDAMAMAKQLPCGHLFHLSCLRAWMQQGGADTFTCPNCRQPLLVDEGKGAGRPSFLQRGVLGALRFAHMWVRNAAFHYTMRAALVVLDMGPWRSSSDPVVDMYLRHLRLALRRAAVFYAPSRTAHMMGYRRSSRAPGAARAGREGHAHRSRSRSRRPGAPAGLDEAEMVGESVHASPGRGQPTQHAMGWGVTWQDLPTGGEQGHEAAADAGPAAAAAVAEEPAAQQAAPQGRGRTRAARGRAPAGSVEPGAGAEAAGSPSGPVQAGRSRPTRGRSRLAVTGHAGDDAQAAAAAAEADVAGHSGRSHGAGCRCCAGCTPARAVWRVRGQSFARVVDDREAEEQAAAVAAAAGWEPGPSGQAG
eukprot:CAMPEP_0202862562 /NCGR_PEP_ID=MMETSP1391-20130828/3557_1 /ASSEMBLY_ACC=CAM_ASM_000867 /TAXON_ID=1034604 /ORGANISM="Chlamydomonas leiostraca, Strain SAG 11-49" /LENGTH=736 /DNA_ID=CAMNT_0049542111 /DNA_START=87 /DNA_END=2294 /DNA_ORIENTATION=-